MTTDTAPTPSSKTGFLKTLIDGNEGGLKADELTPAQKLSLRFVVIGLIYFGFAAIEGMLMRIYQIEIISFIGVEQYFGILTAHPLVGIFGSSYMIALYAAIYVLFPLLTNGVKLYSQWMANVHFWGTLVGGIGMGAFMGMAGLQGMLRRTIYMEGEFTPYMWLAGISGALILIGFIFFMINIIMSVGLKGLLGIFTKSNSTRRTWFPQPDPSFLPPRAQRGGYVLTKSTSAASSPPGALPLNWLM